jgi:hypothetical protein
VVHAPILRHTGRAPLGSGQCRVAYSALMILLLAACGAPRIDER